MFDGNHNLGYSTLVKVQVIFLYTPYTVEDTGNNVFMDYRHKDGHAYNVGNGHTYAHVDACTWYDVVSKQTIGGKNM